MENYENLNSIFSGVLLEIISTISGFTLDVISQETDYDFDEMTGVMSLNGDKSGVLFISVKRSVMRLLCSYMTGLSQDELTNDEINDALCELVNMTAGSAKLRLSGSDYVFNLSSPFILESLNMKAVIKKKSYIISAVLGNDDISMKLKVIY